MAKGESRNITVSGIFVHCAETLRKDKIYQMILDIPRQNPLLVKGRVIWSNLDGLDPNSTLPGMGFFFIQLSEADKKFLIDLISAHDQK